MTHEEAIKNINALNAVCGQKDLYDAEFESALVLAIDALAKQIPKKIVKGKDLFWEYQCPNTNCDTQFTKHASYAFCPGCGQALDWSVNE